MKFRKKPVVIEAVQFTKDTTASDLPATIHIRDQFCYSPCYPGRHAIIKTLEGEMAACPGDWIITGIKGEHYPCKPDIFAATYEPVEPQQAPSKAEELPLGHSYRHHKELGLCRDCHEPEAAHRRKGAEHAADEKAGQ